MFLERITQQFSCYMHFLKSLKESHWQDTDQEAHLIHLFLSVLMQRGVLVCNTAHLMTKFSCHLVDRIHVALLPIVRGVYIML